MDKATWNTLINLVDRMNDNLSQLNDSSVILHKRINDLEVKLDNLRVQYDRHGHPYKHPPVYGGSYGGGSL